MKKLISLLLAMVMATAMLMTASCKKKEETPEHEFSFSAEEIRAKYDSSLYNYDGQEVEISMAHWDSAGASIERAVLEQLLESFYVRYPKIKVIFSRFQMSLKRLPRLTE